MTSRWSPLSAELTALSIRNILKSNNGWNGLE
ncbi:unnamed protein product, partial [Rotaria magnacalcarata]